MSMRNNCLSTLFTLSWLLFAPASILSDCPQFELVGKVPPQARPWYFFAEVAARFVYEKEAGVDLNGDGDIEDWVLHVLDRASGKIENLEFTSEEVRFADETACDDPLWFAVKEFAVGQDLNDDGDRDDEILHVYHDGSLRNLRLAGFALTCTGGTCLINVREEEQGRLDLNHDGDAGDFVLHGYNLLSGEVTNYGLAVLPGTYFDGLESLSDGRILILVWERDQGGSDLNGDGDAEDGVLHLIDTRSGAVTNLEIYARPQVLAGVLFGHVWESGQGNLDLNGDGYTDGEVIHVYDTKVGAWINLGIEGEIFYRGDDTIVIIASERREDLNNDGVVGGRVVYTFKLPSGPLTLRIALSEWIGGEVTQRMRMLFFYRGKIPLDLDAGNRFLL